MYGKRNLILLLQSRKEELASVIISTHGTLQKIAKFHILATSHPKLVLNYYHVYIRVYLDKRTIM